MKGVLTREHAAHVDIELFESKGVHDVIVDTGFSDFLYLPEDRIAAWNPPFIATVPVRLADRTIVVADVYTAHMLWFSSSQRVTVTAGPVECDSLIGMRLLEGCRIELDELNGEVRIEQL